MCWFYTCPSLKVSDTGAGNTSPSTVLLSPRSNGILSPLHRLPGDDYISIHVRNRGDWTSQLRAVFSQVSANLQKATRVASSELISCRDQSGPRFVNSVYLLHLHDHQIETETELNQNAKVVDRRPLRRPAQDYEHYDVLLLIGLGIGATPLIRIVKDVLNNIQKQKQEDRHGGNGNGNGNGKKFMTQRAYFYWVTQEEGSFEWFRGIMNKVAEKDEEGVFELHNHNTSMYEEGIARSALILMLQALHHAKNGVDIVTGTE